MWIKIENEATTRLFYDEIMDEPVEFNDNRTANVDEEVAEAMIEHYDSVHEYNKEENE